MNSTISMISMISRSGYPALALTALLVCTAPSVHAATIAVIDSGTDLEHGDLAPNAWVNPRDIEDAVDNDDNGYIDDVHGWNFAEGNWRLVEKRRFRSRFTPDVNRFFEIQTRMLRGEATPADLAWVKAKRQDPAFLKMLQTFGNYMHGTHVAGIASREAPDSRVMGIKLLPTQSPTAFEGVYKLMASLEGNKPKPGKSGRPSEFRQKLFLKALELLAAQQGQTMAPIGTYLDAQGAQVANCSFGTSHAMVKQLLAPIAGAILGRAPTDTEMDQYAKHFITAAARATERSLVRASTRTLFVIAAGNDGQDNDTKGASPANIKADNAITVAATDRDERLASFSNRGATMVEIAAPGVAIRSAIPGGGHLEVSGTSQATPWVANVAGRILDANPRLSPAQVKEILMGTVEPKDFLQGKVKTGGVVSPERALLAARYSNDRPLSRAIEAAKQDLPYLAQTTQPPSVGAGPVGRTGVTQALGLDSPTVMQMVLPLPALY